MKNIFLIITIFFSSGLFASGIPIDSNGNITIPHTIIKLNNQQQLFLDNHRFIVLTISQKKELGENWVLDTVEVLDPNHHDCTCARIYGIWINKSEVAFLNRHIYIEHDTTSYFEFVNMSSENILYYEEYKRNHLYIGFKGDLFYLGKLVTLEKVKEILNKKEIEYFLIFLPPKKNNKYWGKIKKIKEEINKVDNGTAEIHWM